MIYCLIDFRIILQNRNFSKDPIKIGLTDRTERFFPLTGFLCQISVKLNHFFRGSPHHFMNIHSTFDAAKFHPHQKGTVSLTVGQSNIFLIALPHPTAGRNFMNTAILTMNRCKAAISEGRSFRWIPPPFRRYQRMIRFRARMPSDILFPLKAQKTVIIANPLCQIKMTANLGSIKSIIKSIVKSTFTGNFEILHGKLQGFLFCTVTGLQPKNRL